MAKKRQGRNWFKFFLGSYTPPEFIPALFRFFFRGGCIVLLKKLGASLGAFYKARRALCFLIAAVVLVGAGGLFTWNFIRSRRPRPIQVSFDAETPASREFGFLRFVFWGSAAPLEAIGKEFSSAAFPAAINPSTEGTWSWKSDDTLEFVPATPWGMGKKYTVTFGEGLLAPHLRPNYKSYTFTTEAFALALNQGEFYIDPEDAAIKRVTAAVRTNYPMDGPSLESSITIEPQISADSGRLQKRLYGFTVSYNQDRTEAYIVSEPLGTPASEVAMAISIKRGVRDALGDGRTERPANLSVTIPGMTGYARVQGFSQELVKNDDQKFDQVLVINTRGTIEEEELTRNIRVWELPPDRPELPGLKAQENHRWTVQDMVPQVLAQARELKLEPIPGENRYNAINSYKFTGTPGRYLYLRLDNKAKFYGDYYLNEAYESVDQIKSYPKELAILSEGSILPLSGDKRLALFSRGIGEVTYLISRVRPDDLNHLVSQSQGDLKNFNFSNSAFSQFNVSEVYQSGENLILEDERDISYFSFDFSRYLDLVEEKNLRHGLFIFTVQGGGVSSRRFIMVSDLGFFVKTNAGGSRDIFVQSIATGDPVAGASVQVLGLNGNPIVEALTGPDGHVRFPDLAAYRNEQAPTVYTVRLGEDLSFMPYRAAGRTLDYSSFDVGGLQGAENPRNLRAFLFSDRGLYRPGDQVHIAMAVKSGDWGGSLEGTPLECTVSDPRGQEIYNRRLNLSAEGVEELSFRTQDWSPTGTYTASVYVIRPQENGREQKSFLGSQTVKVEEFLPDTLSVSTVFEPLPREGWIAPGELKALVTVRNLFGTPAAGNEVRAQLNLTPGRQYFRSYRDYRFQDPYQTQKSYQEPLGTLVSDSEGRVSFNLDTAKFERAAYSLSFYAEALEKGSGRGVSTEAQVYVSPLPYLLGYKADGNLGYIQRDSVRKLSFIAIDSQVRPAAVEDLNVSLQEIRYVNTLVRQSNGLYKYQSVKKEYPLWTRKISIPAGGMDYEIPTAAPGEFRLVLSAPAGASGEAIEFNSVNFSVAGSANLERSLNRSAELEISLDKNDFVPGEEIKIMIKAPYQGAGLITVEQDKVYAHRWFRSDGGEETVMSSITVPQDLEGNGYVNVHFIRSQSSPEIFMPPLSYGAAPFSISRENRVNRINLDIPGEAKPGEDFIIKYSASKPGKIVVYAVDEGILQLAGYSTPDPLGFFFRKRALSVRTAQILDLALPSYAVSMAAMGGGSGYDELARNLNPFKRKQNQPVVYWSGIVEAGTEERELRYLVPDYFNGTLRVMAVAVSPDSVGAAEDRSFLQNTFILSPNGPLSVAPGDEFEVSLTVTNMQRGEGDRLRLVMSPSAHLSISGPREFDLEIPEGKDRTLSIPVKAAGPLGAAEIRFTASNGGESSSLAAYLSVRPAVPYRVSLQSGALRGRSVELAADRRLYEEFHTRELALSYLPTGLAKGLSFYLNNYPYGCTEQLVSAAFPFLYPRLFSDLGYSPQEAEEGIYRIIEIIQARLKENGEVGMYTSHSESDPLITVYACHFLTEARNAGYYVSQGLMDQLTAALRSLASSGEASGGLYGFSNRAYAVYVLTLNEIVTTPLLESLKRDMNRYGREPETDLPGLYLAGTYALLQKSADASSILGRINRTLRKDDSLRYVDSLLYYGLYLNILSRHFPQRLRDLSEGLLLSMAEQLEHQGYTTISANFALMGLDAYLKTLAPGGAGETAFTALEILRENRSRELGFTGEPLFTAAYSAEAEKIRLESRSSLNLFYQMTSAGFDLELPAQEQKNGIEVYREFLDSQGKTPESLKAGDEVTVRLTFRSLNSQRIADVALVDLFPAGLEADIQSVRDAAEGSGWRPDYADIREDRLVLYGSLSPQAATFSYRARAVGAGLFTVPPLFAEAMYDKTLWAQRPQENLRIGK